MTGSEQPAWRQKAHTSAERRRIERGWRRAWCARWSRSRA